MSSHLPFDAADLGSAGPGLARELFAHLGVGICERTGPARVSLIGTPPLWWSALGAGTDLDAESLQWEPTFAFLAHFLEDAELVWSEGGEAVARSGVWSADVGGTDRLFDAEAISFRGRKLLLIRSLDERGREMEALMQAARSQALSADLDASAQTQLQAQLTRAKDRAEALSAAKSSLLANVSHEMRTPLSGIIGLADLLERSDPRRDQVDLLRLIEQSASSLLAIINDLLDLSQIEAGKVELQPEPLDLRRLLAEALGPIAIRAHAKGVELNYHVAPEVPSHLMCDGLRLRQVLVNLVGNAIKFTERGEVAVTVSTEPSASGASQIRVSVLDTGPGIPDDRQQRIFEAFEQADASVVRTHGGTGLGLTISARLVALMGGHLGVRSEVGSGSVFGFELPLQAAVGDEGSRPTPRVSPRRALVVDDCETSRAAAAAAFASWGANVESVGTTEEASVLLDAAATSGEPFDVLFASARMPGVIDIQWAADVSERSSVDGLRTVLAFAGEQRTSLGEWRAKATGRAILKPVGAGKLAQALDELSGVEPAAPSVSEWDGDGTGRRVLVADDNAVNRMLASALLEAAGYEVVTVSDGIEAVRAVESHDFDVVLMDVNMPRLDGIDATMEIRTTEAGSRTQVPIVALTAHALEGDRERCLAAGMNGYVSKPIDAKELHETLRALLAEPTSAADASSGAP